MLRVLHGQIFITAGSNARQITFKTRWLVANNSERRLVFFKLQIQKLNFLIKNTMK